MKSRQIPSNLLKRLESLFGKDRFLFKESDVLAYSYDSSSIVKIPSAVVFPDVKEEVIEVLRLAQEYKVPVISRGAGTATTGSSLAHAGGIVVCFNRMNRILELNDEERIVRVEPGVLNGELKRFLKRYGFFYPPDPASYAYSTIGGNVATGAGGPKCFKYGTTKDYVLSLEVVLPGGRVLKTAPNTLKAVVFYNITPLFIGSEGTLGVFTEIVLKVIPLPEKNVLFISAHKKEEEPLDIITMLLKQKITPASAEFIDKTSLKALSYSPKKDFLENFSKANSLLFLELDGEEGAVLKDAKKVEALYNSLRVPYIKAELEDEVEKFWDVRRAISPALKFLGERKISDDVVVPRRYMKKLLFKIRKIERESRLHISCFGHAGDGNFHVNILFDPEKTKLATEIRKNIIREVLFLEGTISGEHGIGYTKRSFVNWELSLLQIEIMKGLKKVFDPEGILNPCIKIPE